MTAKARTLAISLSALFSVGLCLACGSDDDKSNTVKGIGGAAGAGGSGGTGAIATGGSAGSTGGGAGQAGSGGAGGQTCGDFGQTPDCKTCLQTNCCSETAKCEAEADCKAFVECARLCPDPADTGSACMTDCIAKNNAGGLQYNPLVLCLSNSCTTMCTYL